MMSPCANREGEVHSRTFAAALLQPQNVVNFPLALQCLCNFAHFIG